MKKILAMMLTAAMMLSMGTAALAADEYVKPETIPTPNAIESEPKLHMDGANDSEEPAWYINFQIKGTTSYEIHLVADGELLTKVTPVADCPCEPDCGLTSGNFNKNCKILVESAESDHWIQTPWTAYSSVVPDEVYMYNTEDGKFELIGYRDFEISSEEWGRVFADEKYTDMKTIDLAKLYKIANPNTQNPAETFTFKIENAGMTDTQYTEQPSFENDTYTIYFEDGEAEVEGDTNSTPITLPEYEHVGIFTYKITEVDNHVAGVTYDENALYLKVTVIEQDGEIRVASLRYADAESGAKDESFKNTYSAGDLAINKQVTGNLGEKDRDFTVKVTFTKPQDKYVESIIYSVSDAGGSDKDNINLYWPVITETDDEGNVTGRTQADTYTATINLKHNETVTFKNLPYEVTYTVVENDYTVDGYAAAVYTGTDVEENVVNGKVDSASESVVITNTKGAEVDTGISVDSIPYIAMHGVVAVGGAGFLVSKKRRSED